MDKKEKANVMDPNRFKIAKNMAVMPGGPENNNPMNVTSVSSPQIKADSIYGDYSQAYPQMGDGMINPQGVPNSGLTGTTPMGQLLNGKVPYNMQQQPGTNAEEPMEGMRLGQDAMNRGLATNQFMGVIGTGAMMPGALDPTIPGGSSPLGVMPTTQQVVGGEMVPGSTPTKIQKKGKK